MTAGQAAQSRNGGRYRPACRSLIPAKATRRLDGNDLGEVEIDDGLPQGRAVLRDLDAEEGIRRRSGEYKGGPLPRLWRDPKLYYRGENVTGAVPRCSIDLEAPSCSCCITALTHARSVRSGY
jgi:hypothetical protein